MTPQRQLQWANFWSIVGMLPFGLVMCWWAAIFATGRPGHPGIFMLDPIGLIGLGLFGFMFMVAVAGPQLWWGWCLTSAHANLHTSTARVLRVLALVLVFAPGWLPRLIG